MSSASHSSAAHDQAPLIPIDRTGNAGDRFAFDPVMQPWLYDGVRTRRIFAFLLDIVVLTIFLVIAAFVIGLLGILTFGVGWLLYAILFPVLAMAYIGLTMGGPKSATPGMQAMGIEMRLWHGGPMYGLIAIVHALLFYFAMGTGILWLIVLGASLFSTSKRCLHDILLGTVVINNSARVAMLRG